SRSISEAEQPVSGEEGRGFQDGRAAVASAESPVITPVRPIKNSLIHYWNQAVDAFCVSSAVLCLPLSACGQGGRCGVLGCLNGISDGADLFQVDMGGILRMRCFFHREGLVEDID